MVQSQVAHKSQFRNIGPFPGACCHQLSAQLVMLNS